MSRRSWANALKWVTAVSFHRLPYSATHEYPAIFDTGLYDRISSQKAADVRRAAMEFSNLCASVSVSARDMNLCPWRVCRSWSPRCTSVRSSSTDRARTQTTLFYIYLCLFSDDIPGTRQQLFLP
jgi:hypothetical protein